MSVETTKTGRGDFESLLTADEIAEIFRVHANTIRSLAAKGEIPSYKIGTHYRFNLKELLEVFHHGKHTEGRKKLVCDILGERTAKTKVGEIASRYYDQEAGKKSSNRDGSVDQEEDSRDRILRRLRENIS